MVRWSPLSPNFPAILLQDLHVLQAVHSVFSTSRGSFGEGLQRVLIVDTVPHCPVLDVSTPPRGEVLLNRVYFPIFNVASVPYLAVAFEENVLFV